MKRKRLWGWIAKKQFPTYSTDSAVKFFVSLEELHEAEANTDHHAKTESYEALL